MVAFNRTDLPLAVDSVEKNLLWCYQVLSNLAPTESAIEGTGVAPRVIQTQPWFIEASSPPGWRVLSRSSIPIASTWQRQGLLYQHALNISTATIPVELRAA